MSYNLAGMTLEHLTHGFVIQHRVISPMGTYPTIEPFIRWAWQPIIGPTATSMLQSLAEVPDGTQFSIEILGRCFGLGQSTSKNAPTVKSVARLDQYVAGFTSSMGVLVVPSRVPLPRQRARQKYWSDLTRRMVEAGETARAFSDG